MLSQLTVLMLITSCSLDPTYRAGPDQDLLFQTSTLSGLSAGDFDGEMQIGTLRSYGNFGLGTYNALDGEMVVLGGEVYQIGADGVARLADNTTQTPFAAVTFFDVDQSLVVSETVDCVQLQAQLDSVLPALDASYAIKVNGIFESLKVRVPHKESEPYPATLADALVDQAIFESQKISGTIVGFRLPEYMAGANAAGYHFHFISDDKLSGGHVLECQAGGLTAQIDTIDRIYIDVSPAETLIPAQTLTSTLIDEQ
jgi:acetolactate decarboxylase